MKISDFKGLLKKSIVTIESIENTNRDYYQVKMKPEIGSKWEPGEHGVFKLPDNKVEGKKWRAFSIASVPEEEIMTIGTRTGEDVSAFKKELISMKKGDKVAIRGPFGWFKIQDSSSPIVMIAGGVGITPVRALLKYLEKDDSRPVELIYSSSDYYLFEEEIEEIVLGNEKLTLHKTHTRAETDEILSKLVNKYEGSAYYYISGARPFIRNIKKKITATGINGNRVINDPFFGY